MSYRNAVEKDVNVVCDACRKRDTILFDFEQDQCPYCSAAASTR